MVGGRTFGSQFSKPDEPAVFHQLQPEEGLVSLGCADYHGELESIERQVTSAAERQKEIEAKAAGVEEEQKKVEAVVHELGSQLIVRQHEVSELAEAATRARVQMGQVQEQRSGISRELATARVAASQADMELQRLAGEIETVAARVTDAEKTIADTQAKLEQLAGKITEAEKELASHTDRLAALRAEFTSVSGAMEGVQEQIEAGARREHELSLSKNELSVRIETLIEHTMEELQINLHETYAAWQENPQARPCRCKARPGMVLIND